MLTIFALGRKTFIDQIQSVARLYVHAPAVISESVWLLRHITGSN